MVTPKPTMYRGRRYRSRLEARWAVLLDYNKLVDDWEYEPTTWHQTETDWEYTPDFVYKLGPLHAYIEVKPMPVEDEYREVLKTFAATAAYPVLLGVGDFFKGNIPTLQDVNDTDTPPPVTKTAWLAGCTAAVQVAATFRFDLATSSQPPPHRRGSREALQANISAWRQRERKKK